MRDYGRIVSKVTSTPWMMEPGALKMMLEILDSHIAGRLTHEDIRVRLESAAPRDGDGLPARSGAVGVLPLYGPLFPKANLMTDFSGATSLQEWRGQFMQMVDDESITSIILDIDSPGGSSEGIIETAQIVREAREVKPVYAVSNGMACSAAYGIAAQAERLFGSPTSLTGNIGTYLVHTDESGMLEKIGVKETFIKAGRFKAVELESLTPEGREYLQEIVDDTNDSFLEAIAEGRGISVDALRDTYGNGKAFASKRALSEGVIDGIASLDSVVGATIDGGGVLAQSFPGRSSSYDADKEHSEPGTGLGGEPTPREPPETGDPAIEGGWRRDPPPPAYETEEAMNREWLEQQATLLGIEFNESMTDEALAQAVASSVEAVVVPLSRATRDAEHEREFAQQYPEQAARLARLEQRDREAEARQFADSYQSFEGQNRGFAPVVREQIESAHLAISERSFTHEHLTNLLNAAVAETAVVPLGETGSARQRESVAPSNNFADARQQFAQLVRNAMTEDGLTREAAIEHVSRQNPELARQYAVGHVQ